MSPVRSTHCSTFGSFPGDLTRLMERGFVAVSHSDITRLKPGEYMIHIGNRRSSNGAVCIYYREC